MGSVKNFPGRTFWNNDGAMRFNLEVIAKSIMGRNLDRVLSDYRKRMRRPVIAHGADKRRSLSAAWFFDCDILYQDEEMRRQVDFSFHMSYGRRRKAPNAEAQIWKIRA